MYACDCCRNGDGRDGEMGGWKDGRKKGRTERREAGLIIPDNEMNEMIEMEMRLKRESE